MPKTLSFDKVVESYFAVVTKEPFLYKGKIYDPRRLYVSPLIFRGFTCPENCGGCCPRFSLDYLPGEESPYELKELVVDFNFKKYVLFSDLQDDHKNHHCRNLDFTNGRCKIHGKQPFSCDFELIRTLQFKDPKKANVLTQKLYGRGWNFLRSDFKRGALCEMLPITEASVNEVIRKLNRLDYWATYFNLQTHLPEIIKWAKDSTKRFFPQVF